MAEPLTVVNSSTALDHLEQSVRRLEQRTHELERNLATDYSTVLDDAVRFSLTNLRSQLSQFEACTGDTGECLHQIAMQYADLHRLAEADARPAAPDFLPSQPQPDLNALRVEAAALARDLAAQHQRHAAEVERMAVELETAHRCLATAATVEAENRSLREQVVDLKQAEARLQRENRALRIQLSEARRSIVDAARGLGAVTELRARLYELGRRYAETLEESGRLRSENTEVRAELRTLLNTLDTIFHPEAGPADPSPQSVAAAEEAIARHFSEAPPEGQPGASSAG